jgi:hypothetical protein
MQTPAFAATKTVGMWKLFRGMIWVAAVMACLCPALAFGQTNSSWNGGTGNWSTSTDWTPNQVPNNAGGNTYDVTIGSGSLDSVILDQNATVSSLTLGAPTGGNASLLTSSSGQAEDLTVTDELTINPEGSLSMNSGSEVTAANVTIMNDGTINLNNIVGYSGPGSTLTVTGTLTNNFYGNLFVGYGMTNNVVNIGMLVNNGGVRIDAGSTVNLTNQPNGITDIAYDSNFYLGGVINAGSNNGLRNLSSIEGNLTLANGESLALTSSLLTVSGGAQLNLMLGSSVTVTNLNNSGIVTTGDNDAPLANNLSVSGAFTNNGTLNVGLYGIGAVNIGYLQNNYIVNVDDGGALDVNNIAPMRMGSKITVNSGGEMVIQNSTLTLAGDGGLGSGTLTMAGGTVTGGSASDVLTNEIVISGYGVIGNDSMGLVNTSTGVIHVQGKEVVLTIDPSSAGFSNQGKLEIDDGDTIDITGPSDSFLNFNATTGTLTGGSYTITDGTLQFGDANIVTNAANIILSGTQSMILNQTAGNGLANFAVNAASGAFELAGDRNLSISGSFSNAGKLIILKGSTFSLGGTNLYAQTAGSTSVSGTLDVGSAGDINLSGGSIFAIGMITAGTYAQTGGTTTVSGALSAGEVNLSGGSIMGSGAITAGSYIQTAGSTIVNAKGTLSITSSSGMKVSAGSVVDNSTITAEKYVQTGGTTTVNGTLSATSGGLSVSGGSVFGIGTITGNIDLTGGLVSAGSASKKAGELTVDGTYKQSGPGAFDVDLGGTTPGTQYDVLEISSTASLGGTLNVDLISGFKPTVGETFDIIDYASETGTFATLNLPKLTGGDTWSITYNATDVVLTVGGPAAKNDAANGTATKAVSRTFANASRSSTVSARQPVAILSRATCFAERLIGAASCDKASVAIPSHASEISADTGVSAGEVHNNIMVAMRSMSSERGGSSRGTSASATTMARLYLCAYLPSGIAHSMGCN